MTESKKKIIFLTGPISGGKSTILDILGERYPDLFEVLKEDLSIFMKTGLLKAMYENPEENQFVGQIAFSISKLTRIAKALKQPKIPLIERSGYSDRYVFAEANKKHFTKVQIEIYNYVFDELVSAFELHSTNDRYDKKFIYLRVNHKICYKRCKKRAREGEELIDINYFKKIDILHENILLPFLYKNYGHDNVIIIENNDDEFTEDNIQKILKFI